MAYGFSPSIFQTPAPPLENFLTPEELQQQEIAARFNASRGGGFVPAMVSALDYVRTNMPAQAPTPRTVSGGDVIGLMPEQTNALLNRVAEQNMLDQRMFEARQQEARQDARAREGRILSAREAQARRQQELDIENQKLAIQERKELEQRMQPKYTPVPSNPGLVMREQFNPNTNTVEVGIEQIPGSSLIPQEQPKPQFGWVTDQGGVQRWTELTPGLAQAPAPPSPSMLADLQSDFMGMEVLNNETGKYEPVDLEFARQLTQNFLDNNGQVVIAPDSNLKIRKGGGSDSRMRAVKTDQGTFLQREEEGMQLAPPEGQTKSTEQEKRDKVVGLLQKQFPKKTFDKLSRRDALAFLRASLDPAEYPNEWLNRLGDDLGFDVDESRAPDILGYGLGEKFNLPASAPAQPASSASFDLKYNPATGTFE